jgi:hypothetical protein
MNPILFNGDYLALQLKMTTAFVGTGQSKTAQYKDTEQHSLPQPAKSNHINHFVLRISHQFAITSLTIKSSP